MSDCRPRPKTKSSEGSPGDVDGRQPVVQQQKKYDTGDTTADTTIKKSLPRGYPRTSFPVQEKKFPILKIGATSDQRRSYPNKYGCFVNVFFTQSMGNECLKLFLRAWVFNIREPHAVKAMIAVLQSKGVSSHHPSIILGP